MPMPMPMLDGCQHQDERESAWAASLDGLIVRELQMRLQRDDACMGEVGKTVKATHVHTEHKYC
jgi:hypothetical protein